MRKDDRRRPFSWGFLISLALLVLSGCGGTSEPTGVRCISESDCVGGEVCFRGICTVGCDTSDDCPTAEVCSDGACIPAGNSSCVSAADCDAPRSACQTVDGATCEGGRCVYPDVVCDSPPASECSADDMFYITYGTGSCVAGSGCVYEPNPPTACADCSQNCAGLCDGTQCAGVPVTENSGCLANPLEVPTAVGTCACEYQTERDAIACPEDDGDPCTRDGECVDGECVSVAIGDGESCVNGDDEEIAGVCLGGECVDCVDPVFDCPDDSNPCTANTCDNNTCGVVNRDGACPLIIDGMEETGVCSNGNCLECLVAADCNDNNSCTADSCGTDGFCVNQPVAVGDACLGESGICSETQVCSECLVSANQPDDSNPRCSTDGANTEIDLQCQIATCVAGSCSIISVADGTSCQDNEDATTGDVCDGGRCAGCVPNDCQSFVQNNGTCVYSNTREGQSCSTGRNGAAPGTNPTCSNGYCRGCDQEDNLFGCIDRVHQNNACVTVGIPRSANQPCDDGAFCTATDRCDGTECVGSGSPCTGQCVTGCNEPTNQCNYRSGSCSRSPYCADGTRRRLYQCDPTDGSCDAAGTSSCPSSNPVCDEGSNECRDCESNGECPGGEVCCPGSGCQSSCF